MTKGFDDPVEPNIGNAVTLIRTEIPVWPIPRNVLFNFTHGDIWIHDQGYKDICENLFDFIRQEGTNQLSVDDRFMTELNIDEVRLTVVSPSNNEETPHGNDHMVYCFTSSREPEGAEERKQVWEFLRSLQDGVYDMLYDWAFDKRDDNDILNKVLAILNNMALFVVFNDRFMGGWAAPLGSGLYKDQDTGKKQLRADFDQHRQNFPLKRP